MCQITESAWLDEEVVAPNQHDNLWKLRVVVLGTWFKFEIPCNEMHIVMYQFTKNKVKLNVSQDEQCSL